MSGRGKDIREEQLNWQIISWTHRYSLYYYLYLFVHLKYLQFKKMFIFHMYECILFSEKTRQSKIIEYVICVDCVFKEYIQMFSFMNRILLEGHSHYGNCLWEALGGGKKRMET